MGFDVVITSQSGREIVRDLMHSNIPREQALAIQAELRKAGNEVTVVQHSPARGGREVVKEIRSDDIGKKGKERREERERKLEKHRALAAKNVEIQKAKTLEERARRLEERQAISDDLVLKRAEQRLLLVGAPPVVTQTLDPTVIPRGRVSAISSPTPTPSPVELKPRTGSSQSLKRLEFTEGKEGEDARSRNVLSVVLPRESDRVLGNLVLDPKLNKPSSSRDSVPNLQAVDPPKGFLERKLFEASMRSGELHTASQRGDKVAPVLASSSGAQESAFGSLLFIKEAFTKPVETAKNLLSLPQRGFARIKSGEGFPEMGAVIRDEPGRTSGFIAAEVVTALLVGRGFTTAGKLSTFLAKTPSPTPKPTGTTLPSPMVRVQELTGVQVEGRQVVTGFREEGILQLKPKFSDPELVDIRDIQTPEFFSAQATGTRETQVLMQRLGLNQQITPFRRVDAEQGVTFQNVLTAEQVEQFSKPIVIRRGLGTTSPEIKIQQQVRGEIFFTPTDAPIGGLPAVRPTRTNPNRLRFDQAEITSATQGAKLIGFEAKLPGQISQQIIQVGQRIFAEEKRVLAKGSILTRRVVFDVPEQPSIQIIQKPKEIKVKKKPGEIEVGTGSGTLQILKPPEVIRKPQTTQQLKQLLEPPKQKTKTEQKQRSRQEIFEKIGELSSKPKKRIGFFVFEETVKPKTLPKRKLSGRSAAAATVFFSAQAQAVAQPASAQLVGQQPAQQQTPAQAVAEAQAINQQQILSQSQSISQAATQTVTDSVTQAQARTITQSRSLSKSILRQKQFRRGRKVTPRVRPDPDKKKKPTQLMTSSKRQAYEVLIKIKQAKQGKGQFKSKGFRKANQVPLSREAALGLGMSLVDKYTNRSFTIRKTSGNPVQRQQLVQKFRSLQHKFRTAKRNRNILIERSLHAIDSPEEKRGIPYEAQRQRSILNTNQNILGGGRTAFL